MKLRLTIQDMEVKATGERYQGLFGTLTVRLPVSNGTDSKDENINFTTRLDSIKGLPAIIESMVVEALALKKLERSQLVENVQFEIIQPNRAQKRALKKKNNEQETDASAHD